MCRVQPGQFEQLQGKQYLNAYKFNTGVGQHHFCSKCGTHTFHNPRTAPDIWSINLRCIESIDLGRLQPKQVLGSKLD